MTRSLVRRCQYCLVVFLAAWSLHPATAAAAASDAPRRVVVAVLDRVVLQDLVSAPPPWPELLDYGAIALMNTTTGGGRTPANVLATVASGAPSVAGGDAGLSLQAAETYQGVPAAQVFRQRTARTAAPEQVVHLGWPQMLQADQQAGRLGTAIHLAGGQTAVIGNADLPGEYRRQAALLAMDATGMVDWGRVANDLLQPRTERLLPVATDYTRMGGAYRGLPDDTQLVVLDLGDMARLDEIDHLALPEVVASEKELILRQSGVFLARLLEDQDDQTLIIFLTPTPSTAAIKEKNLVTPLLVFYPDGEGGWLTSPSTRRAGLVTAPDVTATILSWLGLPPAPAMTGRPVAVVGSGSVEELLEENNRMVLTYKLRPPVIKTYIAAQMVAISGTVFSLFLKRRLLRYWRPVLLGLTSVPLALLLAAGLPFAGSNVPYLVTVVALVVLITLAAYLTTQGPTSFVVIAAVTVAALVADSLAGGPLISRSILGYDPMSGARYYGIGNEYMGVIIGAAILTGTWIAKRVRSAGLILVGAIFGVVIFLLAAPGYGANAGGTVAAVVALTFTMVKLRGWRWGGGRLAALAAAAVGLVLVLGLVDAHRAVEVRSHFGQAAALVGSGGVGEAVEIVARKVTMNIKLIRYSIWSRVLLLAFGAVILLCYRPVNLLRQVWTKYPGFHVGFVGTVVGAGTAFIFNDSGIVAAATMMIFAMAPWLYLLLQERERENLVDKP